MNIFDKFRRVPDEVKSSVPEGNKSYVDLVKNYQPDLSQIDSIEKAKANFEKAFELFGSLCKTSKYESVEALYKDNEDLSLYPNEGIFESSELPGQPLRVRLTLPNFKESRLGKPDSVPTISDAETINNDTFYLFVSKFIENGIEVKV